MARTLIASIVVLLFTTQYAWSSAITFHATDIGGGSWRYDYTLVNDSLAVPVEEFTIFFDVGLYENLRSPAGPAPWDLLLVEPDPGLPDDGWFDGLVFDIADALAPGASLAGFSVEFDFLGTGTPGRQNFEFLTADLELLGSGLTTRPGASVPEPASVGLIAAGLLALLGIRRCRVT